MMAAVWGMDGLSRDELLVMLALADFADDAGMCWPAMAAIAGKARMTERGARGIVRRLEIRGVLTIEEARGRTYSNRYRLVVKPERDDIKPEAETRNDVPVIPVKPERENIKPERDDTKTGTRVPPNHQEPSKNRQKNNPAAILAPLLGADLAASVVEHRRRKGSPLTDHAAQLLGKRFSEWRNPVEAAEEMIARGWQGFKPEWMNRGGSHGRADTSRAEQAAERRIERMLAAAERVGGNGR